MNEHELKMDFMNPNAGVLELQHLFVICFIFIFWCEIHTVDLRKYYSLSSSTSCSVHLLSLYFSSSLIYILSLDVFVMKVTAHTHLLLWFI